MSRVFSSGSRSRWGLVALFCSVVASSIGAASGSARAQEQRASAVIADVVLRGGTVVDGTGAPARRADLGVLGERILAAGTFEIGPGTKVIDVTSLIVAHWVHRPAYPF